MRDRPDAAVDVSPKTGSYFSIGISASNLIIMNVL